MTGLQISGIAIVVQCHLSVNRYKTKHWLIDWIVRKTNSGNKGRGDRKDCPSNWKRSGSWEREGSSLRTMHEIVVVNLQSSICLERVWIYTRLSSCWHIMVLSFVKPKLTAATHWFWNQPAFSWDLLGKHHTLRSNEWFLKLTCLLPK